MLLEEEDPFRAKGWCRRLREAVEALIEQEPERTDIILTGAKLLIERGGRDMKPRALTKFVTRLKELEIDDARRQELDALEERVKSDRKAAEKAKAAAEAAAAAAASASAAATAMQTAADIRNKRPTRRFRGFRHRSELNHEERPSSSSPSSSSSAPPSWRRTSSAPTTARWCAARSCKQNDEKIVMVNELGETVVIAPPT